MEIFVFIAFILLMFVLDVLILWQFLCREKKNAWIWFIFYITVIDVFYWLEKIQYCCKKNNKGNVNWWFKILTLCMIVEKYNIECYIKWLWPCCDCVVNVEWLYGHQSCRASSRSVPEISAITREQDVEGNSGRDKYGAEYCQGRAVLARFQLTATA